jgi:hypothetical protein
MFVMGIRERRVETYLDEQVTALGGLTRKWVSPGRDGVPDRICIVKGHFYLVEVKTIDGHLSPAQVREHKRLREAGAEVLTVYGAQDVNMFIQAVKASTSEMKSCYQCDEWVDYLFDDSRGACCTRLTPEEIRGDIPYD